MRRRYVESIMAVLLLSFGFEAGIRAQNLSQQSPETPAAQFEGQKVVNVAFDPAQQPVEGAGLAGMLPLKPGQTYTAAGIRSSIEWLYSTGRYEDIQADVTTAPGGLTVTFITKNSWFIGNVSAKEDFAEPPNAGQIVNASRLALGDRFDVAQIAPAVDNIRKLLIEDGYFDPQIDPHFEYDDTYQQVAVTFVIKTGKRAHYETPLVSGDTSVLSGDAITKATRWHRFLLPGYRGITLNRTRKGIDDVRLKYENSNRLLATVVLNGIDADGKNGKPRITVNPGPTVTITTPGTKISKRQLRENVPVFEEHTVDEDLLTEGRNNLRDYFQNQGYSDVTVEFQQRTVKNGVTEISYAIERGKRHTFVFLDISGNKYFDQKTIHERLFLTPKSFAFRRGRYSEAYVKRDIQTIKDLYESNGFRDATVTSRVVDDYKGKVGDLALFLTITEGPQYSVASLNIKGAGKLDLSKIVSSLSSQAGQVFSEFNVATDRETIIRRYGENGFPNATFEWNSKPGPRPHTIDLEFLIDEGRQQFVRQVVTTGLETTRPKLVNQQMDLNPKDPLSPAAMADSQKKLYDLGIFSQVNMAIQNPNGDEDSKYVVYDLDEARRYSITTGFGLQFARIGGSNAVTDLSDPGGAPGVSPRVSLALSRLNLFGSAQTLSLQGVVSTLQRRGVINYLVPRIFNWPKFDASFSVLYDDTFDVRTFQSKREEATVKLTQHYSKSITLFYDFTYRHVGVSNLKIDPLLLPQLAQSVRVGIAEVNFVQDRRDDPLDPHKGIYNTLNAGLATSAFGSQTSFVRLLGRNATYYRLGEKLVFARETQIGIQPAFSIPVNTEVGDPIPLAERFFGGGGNTQRGFPENQAGPRDLLTGFPLGGSALFFNNTELRFPLYGANINGVLFEDAGNVYSSLGSISFRTNQRDLTDFDYMVHAVGFGVRYRTPIGPLRLDLAYSINPPKYNGFPGSYAQLVQCSAAGTCQASLQHISHFQFFFSIGQAF
ncbi:MAG TPA: BamA/TamA family outer membrane protein [Bryobacteraceae bacterium]|nr:BamA/TamA family outer membrane protein [Bryobacteraceae bacterium]